MTILFETPKEQFCWLKVKHSALTDCYVNNEDEFNLKGNIQDFAFTAWHLIEWLCDDLDIDDLCAFRNFLFSQCPSLMYMGGFANIGKHRKVSIKRRENRSVQGSGVLEMKFDDHPGLFDDGAGYFDDSRPEMYVRNEKRSCLPFNNVADEVMTFFHQIVSADYPHLIRDQFEEFYNCSNT